MLFEREKSDGIRVSADHARIYMLRQPKIMFEKLCKEETVQKWLQQNYINKQKIYFTIGYRTLLNAKLFQKEHYDTQVSGQGRAPAGAVAGVDPTPTGELDVETAAGYGN